jgi:quercetin dioxygenase-like cupin family protein
MTISASWCSMALILTSFTIGSSARAQLAPLCVENSPERSGGIGCSVVRKELPAGLKEPVYWHIDRFDSIEKARAAAGAAGIAIEVDGVAWLMTIEAQVSDHHAGKHQTQVGPLPLPKAEKYSLQVNAAKFTPGMYSRIHNHSGVEAFYVLEGEQCLETPTQAILLHKGEAGFVPTGTMMRLVAAGTGIRYGVAIIIHDASQPATMSMEDYSGPTLLSCNDKH